jgi:hypothetical protein
VVKRRGLPTVRLLFALGMIRYRTLAEMLSELIAVALVLRIATTLALPLTTAWMNHTVRWSREKQPNEIGRDISKRHRGVAPHPVRVMV